MHVVLYTKCEYAKSHGYTCIIKAANSQVYS